MSFNVEPTPGLDVPLGEERQRAVALLGDRWSLWLLLAIHERTGARFTDLASAPGLSRRVLAERLRGLVGAGLVVTEQYQQRPVRSRYVLSERGQQVRRLALALVHVAAGGTLTEDPLQISPRTEHRHPTDALLAGDPEAARRIHAETVKVLEEYDDRYRTSLLETLETWLACDTSVSVAAARLYAHRHTIRYRLDRVHELTGLDPSTIDDRERLLLGLRARRVLAHPNPVPGANDPRATGG